MAAAQRLLARGRVAEAQRTYEVLAEANPNDPRPLIGLGACASAKGSYTQAIEYYGGALRVSHDHPLAMIGIADAYRRQGDTAHALEWYRSYLESHPDGAFAQRARTQVDSLDRGEHAIEQP